MKLIVGLGNPGDEYARTRHNVGFMVVDAIADAHRINLSQTKFKAVIGKGTIGGEEAIVAKPQTYMNRSGESVSSLLSFFKLSPSDCIVVCDDLELPTGKIRVRGKGGHGGHNGLRSIIELTGSQEFVRVKVGIGRPAHTGQVSDYVLSPFSKDERVLIEESVEKAVGAVEALVESGIETAMNRFN